MPQTFNLTSFTPDPHDPDFELRAAGLVLNMLAEPVQPWSQIPVSEAKAPVASASAPSTVSWVSSVSQVAGIVLRGLLLLPVAMLFRIPTGRRERHV